MQRLFKVAEEDQEEADRILETYLKKRVRDMMYQACVEAVKEYYRTLGQELDDKLAFPIELDMTNIWKARSIGVLLRCGLNFVAIGAQKNSWQNGREGRKLAWNLMILLKIMEDLDRSQRHNNILYACVYSLTYY